MQTKDQQIKMYGVTIEQMRSAPIFTNLNDPTSLIMYAMSILSDAQTVMELGDEETKVEQNRQWINKAKYFMSEAQELIKQDALRRRARGIVCNLCDAPLRVSDFRGEALYSRVCANRCDS